MEYVLKYYQFSEFFKDESGVFHANEICYTILNDTHFLIFEKEDTIYNLYVARYQNSKEIGCKTPEIIELVVKNYKKSSPEHRIALRKYVA